MRTNIDIDDELMAETMRVTGQKTKKGAVEEAMRFVTRGSRLKQLIERTRGMGWNAGLNEPDRTRGAAEDGVPYDPT